MYFVTKPPGEVQSIAISVSVCLSTCTSQKPHVPTSQKFSVHVTCGRDSVLLWQQCNRLCNFVLCGLRHVFT